MLHIQANPLTAGLHMNRCDYLREFGTGVLSSWHHELFGFIVNVKYIMGLMAQEAADNVVALGLDRPAVAIGLSHPLFPRSSDAEGAREVVVQQWEQDGWLAIQEHCHKIIAMAEAFLQSYLQFTSMQEAQAANHNALSLARISNLTMVFIPLSAIAAVFSMTDEFMPGKSKNWIFWVTLLPVLGLTFAITMEVRVWGARVGELWRERGARRLVGVGREKKVREGVEKGVV